ncbi:MAG: glycine cleavage system aminomethyltransferase GcvT [Gammaproteobacteria bacterium]|nr:glycine cleavage system aminomethyltransferase GcvT [Gammaproteobacteria bacterium]
MSNQAASTPAALKQTPLNATHRGLSAKMVDFGGWDMPVNYGSQIEEHHAVRRGCGLFDVSHMLPLDIKGSHVRAFLKRLVANNVDKLQVSGKALYSCMLNEAGGVIDDLIIYFMDESWFRLVVNAGTAEKDLAWMEKMNADWDMGLTLTPRRDLAMIAIQGPNATQTLNQALPGVDSITANLKPFNAAAMGEMFIARTGYTGEDGFEVMVLAKSAPFFWQALMEAGGQPIGLGARDTLRLEAGMNLYGQDMDETTSPLESGLAWTVDLKTERDFVGRAALEKSEITQQLVGLVLLDKGVLRGHQKVLTKNGDGEITSGSFSPTMEKSIALARVPLGIAPGQEVEVEIRDKKLRAKVVKYPFVRNGKVLIEI